MTTLKEMQKLNLGIPASGIDIDSIEEAGELIQLRDEIVVANKFGYMKITTDEYTDMFIESASVSGESVLEIGCAYGYVVQKVLKAGGKITALDVGERNLEILLKQTPKQYLNNLHVYPANFPDEVDFPEETFNAVLAARVLHFLDGETLEAGFDKIHTWLKPNGKFYFTAMSVEHEALRAAVIPLHTANIKKGLKWRGEIENQHIYSPQHASYVPKFVHLFDAEELSKNLPQHGFEIEKIGLFNYVGDTTAGDKGHIGFIARKI